MSVYKSRRKDAAAQFIADAAELRKYTVRVVRKFPKSYRYTTNALLELAEEMGVALSEKKCRITPFRHHSFTFLKIRFRLEESGKVTMKLSRNSIKAMRRKLTIFRRWVDEGKLQPEDVFQSYQSWRAHAKRCDSYDTLRTMDERFVELFAPELAARKRRFKCTMKATKTEAGWIYRRHGSMQKEEETGWNTSRTTDSRDLQCAESN